MNLIIDLITALPVESTVCQSHVNPGIQSTGCSATNANKYKK